MIRSTLTVLALTAGVLASAPTASQAATITALEMPELVVDHSVDVVVAGVLAPDEKSYGFQIAVHLNPPTVACASSDGLDQAVSRDRFSASGPEEPGAFRTPLRVAPSVAESGTACVYVDDVYAPGSHAQSSVPISVREPRTSLSLTAPPTHLAAYESFTTTFTASAEVGRQVTIAAQAWEKGCGPTYISNSGSMTGLVDDLPILGGPLTISRDLAAPDEGHWVMCGYVGTRFTDPIPTTAVTGAPFWVGPTPRCHLGRLPRARSRKLSIRCTENVEGTVELRVRRGSRARVARAKIQFGSGEISAARLGLARRKSAQVSIHQGETLLGSRTLRHR